MSPQISEDEINLKKGIFYGSTFFIFCSLFSLILINFARLGLETSSELNLLMIILIINIGLCPFLLKFNIKNIKSGYIYVKISLIIILSFFLVLLGFISSFLYYFVIIILISISIYNLKDFIKRINYQFLLTLIVLSAFFIINYVPWKIEYFYSPEITLFGLGGNQTMQGAALTNIFKNYKMISMGADGVENFLYKYHYGIYIWWSSISLISNSKPLLVIPFTQMALLIPMVFFACFISTLAFLRNSFSKELLVLTIFTFVLFDIFSGKLHYDSETYTSSIIILLLTIPILNYILKKKNPTIFLSSILIFFIPIISSLKLTTGYLYCIMLGLFFIYNRDKKINYLLIFVAILLGIMSLILFMPSGYTDQKYWRLYSSYNQLLTYQNFFCIFLPTIYLSNLFFKLKINSDNLFYFKKRYSKSLLKLLIRWLLNKKVSYPKIAIISYFFSVFPIFITPVGSTSVYNLTHLYWIFIILALSIFINSKILHGISYKLIYTSFIILSVVIFFKPANLKLDILKLFYEKTLNKEIKHSRDLRSIIYNNLKNEKKIFNIAQLNNINSNSLNLIIIKAKNYQNKYKKDFAIYVPKNNLKFWNLLNKNNLPYWCSSTTLLIPSLVGIQSIKGVQDPKKCETYYIAGPSEYGKESFLDNLTTNEICDYARKKNIKYIFEIKDLFNLEMNKLLNCTF